MGDSKFRNGAGVGEKPGEIFPQDLEPTLLAMNAGQVQVKETETGFHVLKVTEGRPHIVDKIVDREIALVINTTFGKKDISDSFSIRRETLNHGLPYYTTVQAARMGVAGIEALARQPLDARSLQEYLGSAEQQKASA